MRSASRYLQAGVRVQLHAPSPLLTLAVDTGTVVGPNPNDLGYWIVRLDAPATYRDHGGTKILIDVIEMDANLTILEPAS